MINLNGKIKLESVNFRWKPTIGNPTNFSNDNGNYINFGSLIYSGNGLLDDTTEYKLTFLPLIGIEGALGLTSFSATDAVNKEGKPLKVNINWWKI